jgi:hypothetical protein
MGPNWTPVMVNVPITVTLDAYTQYDVVGGLLTSAAVPQIKGGGYIAWGRLTDGATQAEPYILYCYYKTPSTFADSAAFVPLEADHLKLFTTLNIPAANYLTTGTEADVAFFSGKDIVTGEYHMFPALETGKLDFYLWSQLTPDYAAAGDLTLDLCIMVI